MALCEPHQHVIDAVDEFRGGHWTGDADQSDTGTHEPNCVTDPGIRSTTSLARPHALAAAGDQFANTMRAHRVRELASSNA